MYDEPDRDSSDFRVTGYIANSWLAVAEDVSKPAEERKAAILEDMSLYKLSMLTHIFFYCGINFDGNGNVFLGDGTLSPDALKNKEDALALVIECLREVCRADVKISMVIGTNTGARATTPRWTTTEKLLSLNSYRLLTNSVSTE